mmetsp:Transcript_40256/g.83847  ORF Transcript_40256/g.83847 Transcript_40256/m.83847 type:complete len:136 (-) Transcript_40256:65-472(-)
MVGSYNEVANATADEGVQKAAAFAVDSLQSSLSSNSSPHPSYSFLQDLMTAADTIDVSITPRVIQAQKQVVAGMNYKLIIFLLCQQHGSAVTEPTTQETLLGAFQVTVYDRFGSMSITEWGPEMTPEQAAAVASL